MAESNDHLIATAEAAAQLGIRSETLYAYVSRGLITSHKRPGERGSFFDPSDLDALAKRGRGPEPRPDVYIESAITLIENGQYWYRGLDAIGVARDNSFENVSQLLWTGSLVQDDAAWTADPAGLAAAKDALATLPGRARTIERVRLAVAASAPHDHLRTDLRPSAVVATAKRMMATTLDALPNPGAGPVDESIAARLWSVFRPTPPTAPELKFLDFTLGIMADHELAASTSAVRIAASFRANPHHVVAAGLSALSGAFHGGASRDVGRFLDEVMDEPAAVVVGTWLGEGRRIPGLGQPLYPLGDPRSSALLDRLEDEHGDHPAVVAGHEIVEVTTNRGLPAPSVDFALGVMGRAMDFEPHASESLMALARFSGWIAHAIEEYEHRSNLRLRAVYSGPRPNTAGEGEVLISR